MLMSSALRVLVLDSLRQTTYPKEFQLHIWRRRRSNYVHAMPSSIAAHGIVDRLFQYDRLARRICGGCILSRSSSRRLFASPELGTTTDLLVRFSDLL